jgi:hypothetical protein
MRQMYLLVGLVIECVMRQFLHCGRYRTLDDVEEALALMYSNCRQFNERTATGAAYIKLANKLQRKLSKKLLKLKKN